MATYYAKRALEILREEGIVELLKSSRLSLFYQTIRLDLTTKSVHRPVTNSLVRRYLKYKYEYVEELRYSHISPHDVKYMLCESKLVSYRYKNRLPRSWTHTPEKGSFHPQLYSGLVIGGDWDKYKRKHKYDKVYRGLKQHYVEDMPWEATVWGENYKNEEDRLERDGRLKNKINKTEKLYNSIKHNGLLPPDEFDNNEKQSLRRPFGLTVNIGRRGEIIFNNMDGHRRLAIAKILDLEKIPVWVVVRHKQWQELRDEIRNNGLPEGREDLRDHPDLQDVLK